MKRQKWLALFVVAILLFGLSSCSVEIPPVYMFAEIEECYNICEVVDENLVSFYEDPSEDRYIDDLTYTAFVGFEYNGDDFSFKLFAYDFADADTANTYFEIASGKANDLSPNFSDSYGMGRYRRVVVCDNKAYSVYAKSGDVEQVNNILDMLFSKVLFETSS